MPGQNVDRRKAGPGSRAVLAPWLIFMLAALMLVALDLLDGVPFYIDADDQLRALQIRDLLNDGQWFDRRLPFITLPEPYFSPWSRLVDLPYAALTLALKPLFGFASAFSFATHIWPLMLLAGYAYLTIRILVAFSEAPANSVYVFATAIAGMLAIWEFVPGRIDHHNVQLVLMLAVVAGCVDFRARRGGIAIGLGTILSIAVGLEGLPILTIVIIGQVLVAAGKGGQAAKKLIALGWTFAIAALPVSLLLNGWNDTITAACDAYSLPWILGLVHCGLVVALVPGQWTSRANNSFGSYAIRIVSLALPIALAAALLAFLFSQCLGGPYSIIDPVTREFWFNRVNQEQTAVALLQDGQWMVGAFIVLMACICIAALPAIIEKTKAGNYDALIIYCAAILALILSMAAARFVKLPAALVALFVPMAMESLTGSARARRWFYHPALALLPLAVMGILILAVPKTYNPKADPVGLAMAFDCKNADLSVLGKTKPGNVIAPLFVAFTIVEKNKNFPVAALPVHRASPGMRRIALAFTGKSNAVRARALKPFDYLAICLPPNKINLAQLPLLQALAKNQTVPGLTRLDPQSKSRFRLYRINLNN